MFTIIALFFKGFLSGALNILKLIFSDWRILAAIILLAIAALLFYKWNNMKEEYDTQVTLVEQQKKANAVLKDNNKVLHDANEQSLVVVEQVKKDQQQTLAAVKKLNIDLTVSSKKILDLKGKLDNIKTPPVTLSPYLIEAIDGIQKLQGENK